MSPPPNNRGPLASLRRFAARSGTPAVERCELCKVVLPTAHPHLLDLTTRQLTCSCEACALLFPGQAEQRYKKVPTRAEYLADFRLSDADWDLLRIPIHLAFFVHDTTASKVQAFYPSPAGPTETLLPLETWPALVAENPVLTEMEADVEALLVYRVSPRREHYRVPIDACYLLVGIIRKHWTGLSGGKEVWDEVQAFFTRLRSQAHTRGGDGA